MMQSYNSGTDPSLTMMLSKEPGQSQRAPAMPVAHGLNNYSTLTNNVNPQTSSLVPMMQGGNHFDLNTERSKNVQPLAVGGFAGIQYGAAYLASSVKSQQNDLKISSALAN